MDPSNSKDLLAKPLTQDYYQNIIALKPMIFQLFILLFPILKIPAQKYYTSLLVKKDGTSRYKCVVLGRDSSYFVKSYFKLSPNIPKKMFSKYWNFGSTTYLSNVVDAFFNKWSEFQLEQIVFLYALIYSFNLMSLTL